MRIVKVWKNLKDSTILTFLFIVFLAIAYARNHNNMPGIIWADTEGYYMYLPAVLIQHSIHHVPERSMDIKKNEQGEVMMKYTCGVAFFYLPFFIGSHVVAHLLGADTSGFSTPYYFGIMLCGVFWSMVGVYMLLKLLQRHFTKRIAWLTGLCLLLGTNYFFYATRWMGMAHIYNFVLVCGLLLLADDYYEKPATKTAAYTGLLLGWLVLIRPTNIVIALSLLLYNVVSRGDISERIETLKRRYKDIVTAFLFFIIPLLPQLYYWKEMTGSWVSYSYTGESFIYWNKPKIAAVLFDTQNGLILYSPILILSFVGILVASKDRRTNSINVLMTFTVITYIFASWWAWWFGAAYGHRCYIDFYPLFALPMATAIEQLSTLKIRTLKYLSIAIVIVFIGYNIGMTHAFDHSGIWDGPDWRWNWSKWWGTVRGII